MKAKIQEDTEIIAPPYDGLHFLSEAIPHYYAWGALNVNAHNKHLSLVFNRSKLVAQGVNKLKSHTIFKRLGRILPEEYYTIHSEVDAILNLMRKMRTKSFDRIPEGLVMVNFRIGWKLSAPCVNCLVLLKLLNFKHVYFSLEGGCFGKIDLENVNVI